MVTFLTFNLEVNVVLLESQVVGGDAGVLSAVVRLSHQDLQCTVLMDYIGIAVLDAHMTVFEPTEKFKRQNPCRVTQEFVHSHERRTLNPRVSTM